MGDEPVSHGLGKEVLNIHPITKKRGVTLDFNLDSLDWFPTNANFFSTAKERCAENGKTVTQCIEFISVHEFGHVLGLSHEQNRKEDDETNFSPHGLCNTENRDGEKVHGNTTFTDYDPNSIMNYCRQKYWGDKSLSKTDAISIKAYYGRIPTYTWKTATLDIPRVIYAGRPYPASLKFGHASKFEFIGSFPTNDRRENQSCVNTTFTNSLLTLPLVRFMKNGKVEQLWKVTLRQESDGKFSIIQLDVHQDSKTGFRG